MGFGLKRHGLGLGLAGFWYRAYKAEEFSTHWAYMSRTKQLVAQTNSPECLTPKPNALNTPSAK